MQPATRRLISEFSIMAAQWIAQPLFLRSNDFYLTNPIARASATMAECSAVMSGATKLAARMIAAVGARRVER